jgi:hypothetical protein
VDSYDIEGFGQFGLTYCWVVVFEREGGVGGRVC